MGLNLHRLELDQGAAVGLQDGRRIVVRAAIGGEVGREPERPGQRPLHLAAPEVPIVPRHRRVRRLNRQQPLLVVVKVGGQRPPCR